MRILLIEDDKKLGRSIQYQLEAAGFSVDFCLTGEDGLHYALEAPYDLILLDRLLPGMDGVEVLRELRRRGKTAPIMLLTALGSLPDKVGGLDAGADDYLVKPFEFQELLARVRSLSRRPRSWNESRVLAFGDLSLDSAGKSLTGLAGECELSKREAELLEAFLCNPGQTMPRDTLILRVWGPEAEVEGGNLDNYIHFLRRRLRFVKSAMKLANVRGIGYRLEGG